jgi:endonuclease III
MPMDDRSKAVVRALLGRHPNGYLAGQAGFTVTKSAAGLFRLLCIAILAHDSAPAGADIAAAQAIFERGWISAQEMAKAGDGELAEVIERADYRDAKLASHRLASAARLVLDRYDGNLEQLRDEARDDPARLRELLSGLPGMDDAGCAVFLREAQAFWPEAGPFIDDRAARAAERLGLPADAQALATDVARGRRDETLSWLAGALALVDARDEYDQVARDGHGLPGTGPGTTAG